MTKLKNIIEILKLLGDKYFIFENYTKEDLKNNKDQIQTALLYKEIECRENEYSYFKEEDQICQLKIPRYNLINNLKNKIRNKTLKK